MSHKYLTINERNKIEVLLKENYPISKTVTIIGVHRTIVYREIKRYNKSYHADYAQKDYNNKIKRKKKNLKASKELLNLIKMRLKETWSPEQIIGRELKNKLSFKTIYNWIYRGVLDVDLKVLRRKGKSRKAKETRGRFNIGTSIDKRPKKINKREEFGHWELIQ